MNKVITISLNGKTYNLEENGYGALRAYLDNATARLSDNPDKEEIVADLELAIADKCDNHLTSSKNVISSREIEAIIGEMGPVEGGVDGGHEENSESKPFKKLYRLKEGAVFAGVCNGLGAYFNIDVSMMRIIFVGLVIITGGAWIVGYILLAWIIPRADTPEEKEAATGRGVVTAQYLIDRASKGYENFKSSKDWNRLKYKPRDQRK